MKHIKSIVSLLLALTLALSLTACGSQANTEPEQPDDTPTERRRTPITLP